MNDPLSVSLALDAGIDEYFVNQRGYQKDNTLSNMRIALSAFSIAACACLQFLSSQDSRLIVLFIVGMFMVLQGTYSLVTSYLQGSIIFQGKPNKMKDLPALSISTSKKEKYAEEFTIKAQTERGVVEHQYPLTDFFTTSGILLTSKLHEVLDRDFSNDILKNATPEKKEKAHDDKVKALKSKKE